MNDLHVSTAFGIGGAWLAEYTLTSIHASVVVFDGRGRVVQWDERAAEMLGLPEELLAGLQLHDRSVWLRDDDGELLTPSSDPVMRVLDCGEPTTSVLALQVGDGVRLLTGVFLPIYGLDKLPNAVLASFVDTSASAGGERVAEIERRLDQVSSTVDRSVFDDALTASLIIDARGQVAEWNLAALELLGRNDVGLIGARFSDVCVTPIEWLRGELRQSRHRQVQGRTSIIRRDDEDVTVLARASSVDWPGVGGALLVQLLDPRRLADELHWRGAVDKAFDHVLLGLLRISADGRILAANAAASALFHCTDADLVGAHIAEWLNGLRGSDLQQAIDHVDAGSHPVRLGVFGGEGVVTTALLSPGADYTHGVDYLVQLITTSGTEEGEPTQ